MGSYGNDRVSEKENHVELVGSLGSQDEEECIIKWRIPKSHKGGHILRKLFSQFIKEIVEGMIGYVRLPTIMSKLLSDNVGQEFGDFKLTILGMLGTYGFERRILVCLFILNIKISLYSCKRYSPDVSSLLLELTREPLPTLQASIL